MESVDRLIAEIKHDSEYGRMATEAVKKLLAIATEIDREHMAALEEQANGLWAGVAKHYVELPHDSEGLPIRLGDMVEDPDGDVWSVDSMTLADDGWTVNNDVFSHFPDDGPLKHYAPTVEDVLREFAEKMNENLGMYTTEAIDADEWRSADRATIAKYAKRLTLRAEVDG